MRVGLISDTHDNAAAIGKALGIFREAGVLDLIHCGDICSAATLQLFSGFRLCACRGNNDWEVDLGAAAERIGGTFAETLDIELGGKRFFVAHGHRQGVLLEAANSGEYDYVLYGHSHRRDDRRAGRTRIVNPGALYRAPVRTVAILDLENDGLESKTI